MNIKEILNGVKSWVVNTFTPKNPYLEDILAYGIEWEPNSSTCTRVGNMTLHKELPVQSSMKGCVEKDKRVVYWLDPNDWSKKLDGTASVLDGTDGNVCVHIDKFYGKSWENYRNTGKKRVMISTVRLDNGWEEISEQFIDAYRAVLDRTDLKLLSIVNSDTRYRGGNNSSTYDESEDIFQSNLGKPVTSIARSTARNYARAGGAELLDYNTYKWIFYWLFAIEYCTFNSQDTFNASLTPEGFHQGGLGIGVTNWSSSAWSDYNSYNPIIPCGYTNSIGNNTGEITITINNISVKINRYRGIELPFGDIWTNLDGVIIDANHSDNDLVYTTKYPYYYGETLNPGFNLQGLKKHTDGPIIEFNIGDTGDLFASNVSGSSYSTGKYDRNIPGSVNNTLRALFVGGNAYDGAGTGLGCLGSNAAVSRSTANIGFRCIRKL